MKASLIFIGKEDADSLQTAIGGYAGKIKYYVPFEMDAIPYLKNTKLSVEEQKKQEGLLFLKKIEPTDFVVLLDEHGKELTSIELSQFMQQQMVKGIKRVLFLIGGAYGFSQDVYKRANYQIALSRMTFPHILTRLIFTEQLYRAMTILKGEPYHHQ